LPIGRSNHRHDDNLSNHNSYHLLLNTFLEEKAVTIGGEGKPNNS